jgi:putative DNA primase/helicase
MAHPLDPLLAYPQWIPVRLVPQASGRTEKLPVDFRTGQVTAKGSDGAHDPAVWMQYSAAATVAQHLGPGHTVGFVLADSDPFFCVDIDNALQPDNTWSPLALELFTALPGCMVEVSQSGRGLHLWGRSHAMPAHASKNVALHIECYSRRRFIALGTQQTGTMAEDCPSIAAVVARYFPPRQSSDVAPTGDGPRVDWRGPLDDDDLLRRALQSRSAASVFGGGKATFADLWHANASVLAKAYPPDSSSSEPFDRSSADAALFQHLAFWTGCDQARALRIAQRSALKRDKWQRDDYIERTITNACRMQREVLQLRQSQGQDAIDHAQTAQLMGSLFIAPQDPMNTARAFASRVFAHGELSTLKHWQGQFYRWQAGAWGEAQEGDICAPLYGFIEANAAGFKVKRAVVADALHALRHAQGVHLESRVTPPAWLDGAAGPPAAELVACANGILHLPTGQLHDASPQLFNLNALPLDYSRTAAAPAAWLQFLGQVWPDDPEAIATLQEVFGYLLTPDTALQKIFLIVGPKRSGKGTIARVLTALLGPANVASPTLSSMAKDFGLQPLIGKLAAVISDARLSGRADQKEVAENLLRISGEDQVEVNRKFLQPLALRLGVRFVLLSNELPRIADASGAVASRFVILKMGQSFYGREDPGLSRRLVEDLPGVLSWAVAGWHRLQARRHFLEPRSSYEAAQELADLGSPVGAFVREECHVSMAASVKTDDLFAAWQTWCVRQGSQHPGSKSVFGRDLVAAFPSITRGRPRAGAEREQIYQGIGLRGPVWAAAPT